MEFEYTLRDVLDLETGQTIITYIPLIDCFFNKRGVNFLGPISCLLDSGADFITMPAEFADYFKINVNKYTKKTINIVGGSTTIVYEVPFENHKIIISIPGLKKSIKETIHFCKGHKIPLLGRNFFKNFDITFKKEGKKFEIN